MQILFYFLVKTPFLISPQQVPLSQTTTQVFSVDIAKFLRIVFLYNTPGGCFWQSCHGTVRSARVPVLWFRSPKCIRFWSETFTKRCTNKQNNSENNFFLTWIDWSGVFDYRIYFGKTIAFDFDEKLTQSVAQVTV